MNIIVYTVQLNSKMSGAHGYQQEDTQEWDGVGDV